MGKIEDAIKKQKQDRIEAAQKARAELEAKQHEQNEAKRQHNDWYFRNRLPVIFDDEDSQPEATVKGLRFRYKGKTIVIQWVELDEWDRPIGATPRSSNYEIYIAGEGGSAVLGREVFQEQVLDYLDRIK